VPDIQATYIEVSAEVRYWEGTKINGQEDIAGDLVPFRRGDLWCPVIRLEDGLVMDWPARMTADIHYKICDAGQYWLLDDNRQRIAKWAGHYVPDDFLCHGSNGYGDYIIFKVNAHGLITGGASLISNGISERTAITAGSAWETSHDRHQQAEEPGGAGPWFFFQRRRHELTAWPVLRRRQPPSHPRAD